PRPSPLARAPCTAASTPSQVSRRTARNSAISSNSIVFRTFPVANAVSNEERLVQETPEPHREGGRGLHPPQHNHGDVVARPPPRGPRRTTSQPRSGGGPRSPRPLRRRANTSPAGTAPCRPSLQRRTRSCCSRGTTRRSIQPSSSRFCPPTSRVTWLRPAS